MAKFDWLKIFKDQPDFILPGSWPLDLSLTGAEDETPTAAEQKSLREHRIPTRCLPSLRDRASVEASRFCMGCAILSLEVAARALQWTEPSGRGPSNLFEWVQAWSLFAVVPLLTALITLVFAVRWLRLRFDMRRRRVTITDGEMDRRYFTTNVTYREGDVPPEEVASFWFCVFRGMERFGRSGDPNDWPADRREERVLAWVRIAGRVYQIQSPKLHGALGVEVRYRLYLSAHAHQLIAIESVDRDDRPGGYRTAPHLPDAPR
jgi:hypothetical protein